MNKLVIFSLLVAVGAAVIIGYQAIPRELPSEKVYVAVEGDGIIAVINPATNKVISKISLTVEHDGGILPYQPHNVQVAPDMQSVWVTANSGSHQGHAAKITPSAYAHGEEEEAGDDSDEVIIIDPKTDRIVKRIPIDKGIHLAHIVLTPDSKIAIATAQTIGAIYKINTETFEIEKKIFVPTTGPEKTPSEPHGLRVSPDGKTAYIANFGGKSLGILDIASNALSIVPLGGKAVQAGVTADGNYAVVSLYDTKRLAVYDTRDASLKMINLPEGSKGPIQMYATPDSRYVYLADQGYYSEQPQGSLVYKIDLERSAVVKEITAGDAPHGVALSHDGARVYVTNLLSGDLSVIDTASDTEIAKIRVGKEPNGVSVWSQIADGAQQ